MGSRDRSSRGAPADSGDALGQAGRAISFATRGQALSSTGPSRRRPRGSSWATRTWHRVKGLLAPPAPGRGPCVNPAWGRSRVADGDVEPWACRENRDVWHPQVPRRRDCIPRRAVERPAGDGPIPRPTHVVDGLPREPPVGWRFATTSTRSSLWSERVEWPRAFILKRLGTCVAAAVQSASPRKSGSSSARIGVARPVVFAPTRTLVLANEVGERGVLLDDQLNHGAIWGALS
jgi:hypothetical protein